MKQKWESGNSRFCRWNSWAEWVSYSRHIVGHSAATSLWSTGAEMTSLFQHASLQFVAYLPFWSRTKSKLLPSERALANWADKARNVETLSRSCADSIRDRFQAARARGRMRENIYWVVTFLAVNSVVWIRKIRSRYFCINYYLSGRTVYERADLHICCSENKRCGKSLLELCIPLQDYRFFAGI